MLLNFFPFQNEPMKRRSSSP